MREKFIFKELIKNENLGELYVEVKKACKDLEDDCDDFIQNDFQVYVATKIIADKNNVSTALLGMGAGKSYIAAIVANYYRQIGQRVAIVTSQ